MADVPPQPPERPRLSVVPDPPEPPGEDATEEDWAAYAAQMPEDLRKRLVLQVMALPRPWEDRRQALKALLEPLGEEPPPWTA